MVGGLDQDPLPPLRLPAFCCLLGRSEEPLFLFVLRGGVGGPHLRAGAAAGHADTPCI